VIGAAVAVRGLPVAGVGPVLLASIPLDALRVTSGALLVSVFAALHTSPAEDR
jgi:hypothetical protein